MTRLLPGRAWMPLYFGAVTAILYAVFHDWSYDDPYITYRVAANLRSGLGFVYNPGEPILSTTTPLLTMLLAALSPLGLEIPRLANLIGAASLAVGGLLLWDIAGRLAAAPSARSAAAAAGLLLYPSFPLLVSTTGSETALVLALSLAAIAATQRGRYALTGALLGLAVLARADALVLAGVLALDWLLIRRKDFPRFPWAALAAFTAVVLPWLAYSWTQFGTPVPSTLATKQAQGRLAISTGFLPGLGKLVDDLGNMPHYWLLAALAVAGMVLILRRRSAGIIFVAWPALYIAAYAALGVTSYFWYYAPLVPAVIVCAALGIGGLAARWPTPSAPWTVRPPRRVLSYRAAAGLILVALLGGQVSDLVRLAGIPDKRFEMYRAIGLWFSENTPEDVSIGTLEVGIIGYYAGPRPMIDFGGLIRPEVAAQFGPDFSYPQAALWAAERYQLDYLIVVEGRYEELLQQFAVVRCLPVARFAGADFDFSKDIVLYLC